MKIMVETSARHIHVSKEVFEALFGADATLTKKKDLSQPGQYACAEKVTVVGPKGEMTMTILGPERKDTQVEVSLTDARKLGFATPVRESGDIKDTPGCKLIGPKGECEIDCGVIAAKRHMHLTPEAAAEFGVEDKQIVKVAINSEGRKTIYDDVVVRVKSSFAAAMHIDTDEANAACAFGKCYGEVIA